MPVNKSIRKRIKMTKNGKLLKKRAGQNHFNAKQSRKTQVRKKRFVSFASGFHKNIIQYASRTIK